MRNFTKLYALIALGLVACADHAYDPNSSEIDPTAPRVHITTPAVGTNAGNVTTVTVTGSVSDDSGQVAEVRVNDVPATVDAAGNFTAQVPVKAGTNLIHATAKDAQGNEGKESRAVVAGQQISLDRFVYNALTATISAQTIDAVARGTEGYLKTGDLTAAVAPMNPVINVGAEMGPDCLYVQGSITGMDVGDADIVMTPDYGGIHMSADLIDPVIHMHLAYAVACGDGVSDITITASTVHISGMLDIGVLDSQFDVKLVDQDVQITGLDLQSTGLLGTVIDMLSLDTTLGPILGWAMEKFAVPMVNKMLSGLNDTHETQVLGSTLEIAMSPSEVDFTPEGGKVLLDTSLRAKGDSGSFVFVQNTLPAMDMSQGFQLAVADDAVNQLLTSMWSAKGLDTTINLKNGSYGDVGTLFDAVKLETKVPPFVDASGSKLVMTVGDMMASFMLGDSVVTQVAINAQVELSIDEGSDGKLRFNVGTPTTYVDVLDEGIEGANQLSNAQFEAIVSFALSRIVQVGSGSLGAIPLPAFGGVGVTDLSIDPAHGYLIVNGEIQ